MSLISTVLQALRADFPNQVDDQEWRFSRYGMLGAIVEMTNSPDSLISPDLKAKAMLSEGRSLEIPVMKIGDVTIKNQRSCTIGDLENETELTTITWLTLVADVSMNSAQYENNEVKYQYDLNKKIDVVDNAFCKAVEDMIFVKLDTEKSGVYNSALVGVGTDYPLVGNAMQVAAVQQELFYNDLSVIMEEDEFYADRYKVLASTGHKSKVNHLINQGESNDVNTRYQFGEYDFRFSNHHPVGAGLKSSAFIVPAGSIGIVSRINADARLGHDTTTGTEWSVDRLKKFPFDIGTMYRSECTDLSGNATSEHLAATKKEFFQMSVDIGLLTSYNSDPATKAGAIKKYEFE